MGKKEGRVYVADFEATTCEDDCRVWAWATCEVADPLPSPTVAQSLDTFFEHVYNYPGVYYFHNLAYDGSFILDWLLKHNFRHTVEQYPRKGQFSTVIDKMGKFYQIYLNISNSRVKFVDSLKKLPFSVRDIAKAFNLDISKGEIDYELDRPEGWEITPEERDYIERDVKIVAQAMKTVLDQGMKKLTVGADSLADYKATIGNSTFDTLFPKLSPSLDADLRHAYRGGFTYADPRFTKKITRCGNVYDYNSIYPSVMLYRPLPYGQPHFVDGDAKPTEEEPLWIKALTVTAKLKPDHIPTVQIKGNRFFNGVEYQREITEPTTLYMTNVDFALFEEHYDYELIAVGGTYLFRQGYGFFDEYIEKWRSVKENSTGPMRTLAKLHLNSLYGKFATNPDCTQKYPYLEDETVKLEVGPTEEREPVYVPMGIFITSYARDITIRAAQANYDCFAYADTDSLHLLGDARDIKVHPNKFGYWKHEMFFDSAMYLRSKQYLELDNATRNFDVHIAGLPRHIACTLTYDDIRHENKIPGKLVPKRVPGGIILKETDFTINLN